MYTNGSIRTNSLLVTLSLWPLTPSLYNSRWWSHLERFCSQWIMFRVFKMYFRNLLTLLPKHPCFWSTCRFQAEAWIWGPEPFIQRQFHCTRFNSVIFLQLITLARYIENELNYLSHVVTWKCFTPYGISSCCELSPLSPSLENLKYYLHIF